jgi:hypothetical protein
MFTFKPCDWFLRVFQCVPLKKQKMKLIFQSQFSDLITLLNLLPNVSQIYNVLAISLNFEFYFFAYSNIFCLFLHLAYVFECFFEYRITILTF